MFRCQLCKCVVAPRTPPQRIVTLTRDKQYFYRFKANSLMREEKGKMKRVHTDDPGGDGVEIVRELLVCPNCAANDGKTG